MDPAELTIIIGLVTVNVSILGLLFKVVSNGKPKKMNNPHTKDPEDVMLGTMSLAAFKKECVAPIVEAIKGAR